MNKSSVIGFALIGIILLGFSWYNSVQYDKRQREAFIADSIAAANLAERQAAYMAEADSAATPAAKPAMPPASAWQGFHLMACKQRPARLPLCPRR